MVWGVCPESIPGSKEKSILNTNLFLSTVVRVKYDVTIVLAFRHKIVMLVPSLSSITDPDLQITKYSSVGEFLFLLGLKRELTTSLPNLDFLEEGVEAEFGAKAMDTLASLLSLREVSTACERGEGCGAEQGPGHSA